MKKILCIGMSDVVGGIESVVLGYLKYLPKDKWQMDFLSFFPHIVKEEEILATGARVFHLTSRGQNPRQHYREVKQFFKTYGKDYDVVWYHCSSLSSGHIMQIVKKEQIPLLIIHAHASKLEVSSKWKEKIHYFLHKYNQKKCLTTGQWRVACSLKSKEFFYGLADSDVIENGVELERFRFDVANRSFIRKKYQIPEDAIVLGVASRFVSIKNLFFVLKVFRDINRRNPNTRLMMVGDGPLKNDLIDKTIEYKIQEQVVWTGFQADLSPYYSAMDVYLLASLAEGYPVSAIEAQASGLRGIISEKITSEVIKTDLFVKASIDQGSQPWVEIFEGMTFDKNRNEYIKYLEERGAGLPQIASDFYETLEKKMYEL